MRSNAGSAFVVWLTTLTYFAGAIVPGRAHAGDAESTSRKPTEAERVLAYVETMRKSTNDPAIRASEVALRSGDAHSGKLLLSEYVSKSPAGRAIGNPQPSLSREDRQVLLQFLAASDPKRVLRLAKLLINQGAMVVGQGMDAAAKKGVAEYWLNRKITDENLTGVEDLDRVFARLKAHVAASPAQAANFLANYKPFLYLARTAAESLAANSSGFPHFVTAIAQMELFFEQKHYFGYNNAVKINLERAFGAERAEAYGEGLKDAVYDNQDSILGWGLVALELTLGLVTGGFTATAVPATIGRMILAGAIRSVTWTVTASFALHAGQDLVSEFSSKGAGALQEYQTWMNIAFIVALGLGGASSAVSRLKAAGRLAELGGAATKVLEASKLLKFVEVSGKVAGVGVLVSFVGYPIYQLANAEELSRRTGVPAEKIRSQALASLALLAVGSLTAYKKAREFAANNPKSVDEALGKFGPDGILAVATREVDDIVGGVRTQVDEAVTAAAHASREGEPKIASRHLDEAAARARAQEDEIRVVARRLKKAGISEDAINARLRDIEGQVLRLEDESTWHRYFGEIEVAERNRALADPELSRALGEGTYRRRVGHLLKTLEADRKTVDLVRFVKTALSGCLSSR